MRLLVTGGAGFIGSNFIRHMLKKYPEYGVVNFDLLTYAGNTANLADVANDSRYVFVKGDVADEAMVATVIKKHGITHIINFAAETHVDRSIQDSAPFIHTNVVGVNSLLQVAKNNGGLRFHHVSTDEVFGSLGSTDKAFNEKTPYDPKSPYSASKAAGDHLVRAFFNTYNLPVTISNCSNNYGPYQFPEKIHGLFITNLLAGKPVPIYGDGLQIRDWLHVQDHCEALDLILHQGKAGETYCVGGNTEKTNLEIARTILQLLGKDDSMVEHVTDRPGHDRRYSIDSSKIKRELGWAPRVSFEEGTKQTVEWYKNNQDWWKKLKV
ncbi:MAG: dTDP-glucose 4,6-dehydratase [Candidatus Magasanikbacteria bacterium]|nr:dTDP-glucose 4,6-dehydratase [Candidatus Magasanikbacteria bacterium]